MAKEDKVQAALVTARLLADATVLGKTYRCDTLIAANKKIIDELRQGGLADANPAAVKYRLAAGERPAVIAAPDDETDEAPAKTDAKTETAA